METSFLPSSLQSHVASLSSVHISLDVLVLIVACLSVGAIFFAIGRERAISAIFSALLAFLLFQLLPLENWLGVSTFFEKYAMVAPVAAWAGFSVVCYIGISNLVSLATPSNLLERILQSLVLGISSTALLIAFGYYFHFLPTIFSFSAAIKELFVEPVYLFGWVVLQLVAVFIVGKRAY